jgi:hypothetical protein
VPFIVSSPLLPGGARELDIPTNHADLIPTLLGLAGIDPTRRSRACSPTTPTRIRSSGATSRRRSAPPSRPRRRSRSCSHRRRDQRGQRDDEEPVPARRPAPAPLLDRQAAQPPADRHRRGRRRRRAAPRQVLPLLRQRAVLDRPRRARRAPAGRHTDTVTEPEPDEYELYDLTARPDRGAQPRPPQPRRRPLPCPAEHDARAPGRAARRQAPDPVGRRGPGLPARDSRGSGSPANRTHHAVHRPIRTAPLARICVRCPPARATTRPETVLNPAPAIVSRRPDRTCGTLVLCLHDSRGARIARMR